ncbi:Sigma-70 region 2 [bacterium A37T11]|nr:Sigma-70 region 2 [bacterium A37T11]
MAETSLTDEKELLIKLRDGDEKAFTQIYHRYKDKLVYHVLRMLKSEELAEELMQELFLKIWKNREHIDPENLSVHTSTTSPGIWCINSYTGLRVSGRYWTK